MFPCKKQRELVAMTSVLVTIKLVILANSELSLLDLRMPINNDSFKCGDNNVCVREWIMQVKMIFMCKYCILLATIIEFITIIYMIYVGECNSMKLIKLIQYPPQ